MALKLFNLLLQLIWIFIVIFKYLMFTEERHLPLGIYHNISRNYPKFWNSQEILFEKWGGNPVILIMLCQSGTYWVHEWEWPERP